MERLTRNYKKVCTIIVHDLTLNSKLLIFEYQIKKEITMTYLEEKVNEIVESMNRSTDKHVHIDTCENPAFGWDVKFHCAMPTIANILREKHNYIVNRSVSFGVTDWNIISLE